MEEQNSTEQNTSLQSEAVNKINPKEIYKNAELVGIKILDSKESLYKNFNKDFVDTLLNDSTTLLMNTDGDIAKDALALLVNMDGLQKEINSEVGKIDTSKKINFELNFKTPDGKERKAEFKNFTLGYGNMTKGFNHLIAHSNEINTIKAKNELDRICSIPSDLTLAKLAKNSHELIKSFENAIPQEISPESNAFLKEFVKKVLNDGKEKEREALINSYKMQEIKQKQEEENKKENKTMSEEERRKKQAEEIAAKKKENTNSKSAHNKDISLNNQEIGISRAK